MYEMTSYCGLECSECPAYLATQKDDMEELARVAAEWSSQFGMQIPTESILCDGCTSAGRLSGYCGMCAVRGCADLKDIPTCAHCADYVCAKLENCPGFSTLGKVNLERIKAGL